MKVLELLEEIEEIVDTASGFPLTGKIMIDSQELLEIVREIRAELPDEIQQAQWIKNERERIIAEAKNEYEAVIADAKTGDVLASVAQERVVENGLLASCVDADGVYYAFSDEENKKRLKDFENDLWGLTDILKAVDKRLGKTKLNDYYIWSHNHINSEGIIRNNAHKISRQRTF